MPNEPTSSASAGSAGADAHRSSHGTTGDTHSSTGEPAGDDTAPQPPSSEALRHPTGAPTPAGGLSAVDAEPGTQFHANTGMFPATGHSHGPDHSPTGRRLALLTLTALGVVYGDIGTSPLYALKECFSPLYGLQATRDNVFGILSLIVWALTFVVTIKYVSFILRADNHGEGGTFALLALIFPNRAPSSEFSRSKLLVALALFGTALLYGDGIITPAMSVLGAMEGMQIALPDVAHYIVPITVVILTVLFSMQRLGTDLVGKAFGPIMLLWFFVIGAMGVHEVIASPWILGAVNPWYAVTFIRDHGMMSFLVLGSVVLVVTGGEALYADMGHFGKRPIRVAWLSLVFPALLLNYFGQGALLVRAPEAVENPFYLLAPRALLVPLLVLATTAAVVASQALISGAFSITRQGIQLGFIPRLEIRHTSKTEEGQIYIPEVNWFLAVACLIIVMAFQNTSALGAAYGIAVTGTMFITTILFHVVVRRRFGWSFAKASIATTAFLLVDLAFFSANAVKLMHGGWVPMIIGLVLFTLMLTWKRGRALLSQRLSEGAMPISMFLDSVSRQSVHRVAGTAVFMTGNDDGVPPVLLHHLKHNKVLHERVILMSVKTADVPETNAADRVMVQPLGQGFWRVVACYGFMQSPNVPQVLDVVDQMGIRCRPMETSFFLGRERLIPTVTRPDEPFAMPRWRKVIFSIMARNARSATEFFAIPANRVVELGTQIEI